MQETITSIMEGNGNAFAIMGRVTTALKKKGKSKKDIETYQAKATAKDYDHLLAVCLETLEQAG